MERQSALMGMNLMLVALVLGSYSTVALLTHVMTIKKHARKSVAQQKTVTGLPIPKSAGSAFVSVDANTDVDVSYENTASAASPLQNVKLESPQPSTTFTTSGTGIYLSLRRPMSQAKVIANGVQRGMISSGIRYFFPVAPGTKVIFRVQAS